MTDQTLTIILQYIPSSIGAILAGVASIYGAKSLQKGKENGERADVVAQRAEEIHTIAQDNLPGLKATVERHEQLLGKLDTDVTDVRSDIADVKTVVEVVRVRQHDLAQYLQSIGTEFELKKMPDFGKQQGD